MKKLSEYVAKDIKGYEGLYAITSCGKVYSHSKVVATGRLQKGRWLKPFVSAKGYVRVALHKDGKPRKFSVHTLVAMTFCEGHFDGATVNHKDKNRQNNNYTNLEWCTIQQNVEHGIAKTCEFINPEGSLVTVTNLRKWCREVTGIPSYSSMHALYKGKIKVCKGWRKA